MSDLCTFAIDESLLQPQHVHAIGAGTPLWVLLWFIARTTKDEPASNGRYTGIVLGGRPIPIEQIASSLGMSYRQCRRQIARLVAAGYLAQKKTGSGHCIFTVMDSTRWAWKRRSRSGKATDPNLRSEPETEKSSLGGTSTHHDSALGSEPEAVVRSQVDGTTDHELGTHGPKNGLCNKERITESQKPSSSEPSSDSGLSGSTMESKAATSPPVLSPPSKAKAQPSSAAVGLAELLRREILGNKPDYRITERQMENWVRTADLMLRQDGRTEQQISDLIRWVQHDEFWKSNILSVDKLRERFDQLEMKSHRGRSNSAIAPKQNGCACELKFRSAEPMPSPNPAAVRLTEMKASDGMHS